MAGAGYKLFNTGDVLTAAQVNTYLMEQTVMVFADAAARTAALSGVVSEGMISYLKDTNAVEVYNGSAWVASDDPNAIQNTIVDAKGDLITATAADTPARLAVGANNTILTADSSQASGLAWAGNRITYTPTFGSTSGSPSLGNGSIAGQYVRVGDYVYFRVVFTVGSTTNFGTGAALFGLPIAMNTASHGIAGYCVVLDTGVAWYEGFFPNTIRNAYTDKFLMQNVNGVNTISANYPMTFNSGDQVYVWGSYHV